MVDDTQEKHKAKVLQEQGHQKAKEHNYAVAGKGEEVGLIALAHDQEENVKGETQKEKKRKEFDRIIKLVADWVSDAKDFYKGEIDKIDKAISAYDKLKAKAEKGDLELSDAENIILLDALRDADIDVSDVTNENFVEVLGPRMEQAHRDRDGFQAKYDALDKYEKQLNSGEVSPEVKIAVARAVTNQFISIKDPDLAGEIYEGLDVSKEDLALLMSDDANDSDLMIEFNNVSSEDNKIALDIDLNEEVVLGSEKPLTLSLN